MTQGLVVLRCIAQSYCKHAATQRNARIDQKPILAYALASRHNARHKTLKLCHIVNQPLPIYIHIVHTYVPTVSSDNTSEIQQTRNYVPGWLNLWVRAPPLSTTKLCTLPLLLHCTYIRIYLHYYYEKFDAWMRWWLCLYTVQLSLGPHLSYLLLYSTPRRNLYIPT